MSGRKPHSLVTALLLAAPLVGLTAWVLHGALRPDLSADVGGEASTKTTVSRPQPAVAGFRAPDADLPADKLEDRVDGAAEYLRGQGCVRLLFWRLAHPAADLEILVFDRSDGAKSVLTRDAGPERTKGPGDEAQVSAQAVYFRRGVHLVRLFADPDSPGDPQLLSRKAAEIDGALQSSPRAAAATNAPPREVAAP
jgi:hypothetical protein